MFQDLITKYYICDACQMEISIDSTVPIENHILVLNIHTRETEHIRFTNVNYDVIFTNKQHREDKYLLHPDYFELFR